MVSPFSQPKSREQATPQDWIISPTSLLLHKRNDLFRAQTLYYGSLAHVERRWLSESKKTALGRFLPAAMLSDEGLLVAEGV